MKDREGDSEHVVLEEDVEDQPLHQGSRGAARSPPRAAHEGGRRHVKGQASHEDLCGNGSASFHSSEEDAGSRTLRHELQMACHLLEKEVKKTEKVQEEIAATEVRWRKSKDDLQMRLDKAIRRAAEHGLDIKLGLSNETFSEEENFKKAAKLREKESMLAEVRALVSSLSNELARRDMEYAKLADPKRKETEARLARSVEKVEEEEAKSSQLAFKLSQTKESLQGFRAEARAAREAILEQLVNNEEERDKYSHVCVAELVRLLLQAQNSACYFASSSKYARESRAGAGSGRVNKRSAKHLMQELDHLMERNAKLRVTLSGLEGQMKEAKKASQQVQQLKGRVTGLLNKHMKEKDLRFQLGKGTEGVDKKVVVLSDHVERLMLHLKHEVMEKAQAHAAQGRAVREVDLLRARNDTIARKNLRKDRVIVELQEGERILEDQLRLLDDKYAELRAKLNVTRQAYRREVKRYVDEAQAIRVRWEKETRGALPLDLVPLPFDHHLGGGRKTQSAPIIRRRSAGSSSTHLLGNSNQPAARQVMSEGGAKTERLRFEVPVASTPAPTIPPPDINLDLLHMHGVLTAAGEPHEPWSEEKLAGLQQVLGDQKRMSFAAATGAGAI